MPASPGHTGRAVGREGVKEGEGGMAFYPQLLVSEEQLASRLIELWVWEDGARCTAARPLTSSQLILLS